MNSETRRGGAHRHHLMIPAGLRHRQLAVGASRPRRVERDRTMTRIAILTVLLAAACSRAPAPAPAPPPAPEMDARTPVPLLPMMAAHQKEQMRQHLEAVQGIVAGLAADDFDAIAAAAATIAPSPGMAAQCRHMGAGAAGFTEAALHFHDTAAAIGEAAAHRDRAAVTSALGATLSTCTGCHARWRQQIVDEATYTRLTRGS